MSAFILHFMTATFICSIGILLILFVKKGFKKHLSVKGQYNLDLLFLILLAIPFIPSHFIASLSIGNWMHVFNLNHGISVTSTNVGSGAFGLTDDNGWLQDFAVAVDRSAPDYIPVIVGGLWIIGMITLIVIAWRCNQKLRLIRESVKLIEDDTLLSLFSHWKIELGIRGNILIGTSMLVKTPMTIGFFKPMIILPMTKIPLDDMGYGILHELAHCKKRDVQVNTLMCLFQILYWFHPLVYIAFKQMRLDRELACDAVVLELLPKAYHIDYGNTLLNFVNRLSRPSMFLFAMNIGGTKSQIVSRVKHITSYAKASGLLRVKSICIFAMVGIFVLCKIPIVSAFANSDDHRFNFHGENVIYGDFSDFFEGFEGSFVLYDSNENMYTIHNREMSAIRISPNSTYKIFSALIALETGILEMDNTHQAWDGVLHPFESWNQSHNLYSAMQNSVNWYFQALDRQVGMEQIDEYLSQLAYGNHNLSGGIEDFWIESSLRISPLEQVGLLRALHQGNTIFEARHVNTLKDALRLYERNGTVLSGKTGTGLVHGVWGMNGWFVGYVETSNNTFFFATYIQGAENAGGSAAAQITLAILEDKGIF
ncbi:MAG: BlaR1 family beta-lactam sensor/signal transducer [Defluviitaleaceae bacterium]|nr:BlaR1 family beta-lactam sensor/signal transducer [Defluviitaleaceae bacterium]